MGIQKELGVILLIPMYDGITVIVKKPRSRTKQLHSSLVYPNKLPRMQQQQRFRQQNRQQLRNPLQKPELPVQIARIEQRKQ